MTKLLDYGLSAFILGGIVILALAVMRLLRAPLGRVGEAASAWFTSMTGAVEAIPRAIDHLSAVVEELREEAKRDRLESNQEREQFRQELASLRDTMRDFSHQLKGVSNNAS